jgi:hypothetical protein
MNQWDNKISHPFQVGGIETAILDNGAGRGVRVAWINTGSGLRFKVVLDRGMDIAEAFYNQHGLAWISHHGVKTPPASYQSGLDWLRHWGGGLVTTCGLDHMGSPENDEYGDRGLHGQIGYSQAEIRIINQPDPAIGKLDFSLTGVMKQSRVFGTRLELERTISGILGEPVIRIRDKVTNRGNTPAPHMLLYHVNLGWPLVDEGSEIFWEGEWDSRGGELDDLIFHEGGSFKTCPPPLDLHCGTGEACAFIDIQPDKKGWCECGLLNKNIGVRFSLKFRKEQLPWLINWQHWGKGEYVTGLEPGTNPTMGQAPARESGTLLFLEPGESREYDLEINVGAD